MSKEVVLDVAVREQTGTGSARASRRAGNVPGVIYGGGVDPIAIEMKSNEVLKAINSGNFIASMVTLTHTDGKKQKAITKDIQFHVVSDAPMHVDFYRVKESDIIEVEVAINLTNEDICPGLKRGGTLNVVRYSVEVKCPAGSIPDNIEVDLSEADIDDTIHLSDLNLPKGVESAIPDRDPTILSIVGTRAETEEEEEGEVVDPGEVEATSQSADDEGEA